MNRSIYLADKKFVKKLTEYCLVQRAKCQINCLLTSSGEALIESQMEKHIKIIKSLLTDDEFLVFESVNIFKKKMYMIDTYSYALCNKLYSSAIGKIARAYKPFAKELFLEN